MSNIVEPVLVATGGGDVDQSGNAACDQEAFLEEFKKVGERLAQRLREQPVIVAHTENTYNGSPIRRLLSNKFEVDKVTSQLRPDPLDIIKPFDLSVRNLVSINSLAHGSSSVLVSL